MSSASATSGFSATPTDTPPTELQLLFTPSTLDKVSQIFNLKQQPEVVQTYPHSGSSSANTERRAPLFLVHDGSGVCTHYHRFASVQRSVYALHDPKFLDPFDSWLSLDDMADHYTKAVESTTAGPYLLGGWSFGGVVAFEIARRLALKGHEVIGTILIDSPPPLKHKPLSPQIIDAVVIGETQKTPTSETAKAVRALTRRSFTACARLLGAFDPPSVEAPFEPRVFLLRSQVGWRHPMDHSYIENTWLQDRTYVEEAVAGWKTITDSSIVPWVDIPGNHFQVFDIANVSAVTAAVGHAASELEAAFEKRMEA